MEIRIKALKCEAGEKLTQFVEKKVRELTAPEVFSLMVSPSRRRSRLRISRKGRRPGFTFTCLEKN